MNFIQQLINGLTIGSVYGLVAIGFSVVYGTLRLVNFAHGDILMAGTFGTYGLHLAGVPIVLACLGGVVLGIVLGMLTQLVAVRPVLKAHPLVPMMTTLGIGFILRNVVELKYGSGTLPFQSFAGSGFFTVGGFQIARAAVVTLVAAVATLAAFASFLAFTKPGFAVRTVAQNATAAQLMGIPVQRTMMLVYGLGAALGVVGGLLYANTLEVVYLGMGFPILLKAFAAAIIGGIGNLHGALVGGLLLGLLESTIGPATGSYRDAIAFVLLIVVLLVRPVGLFGTRIAERV